jgi:DNA-binding NarL/FixJ family response regulator
MEKKVGVLVLCCNRLFKESITRILAKRTDLQVVASQLIGPNSRGEIADSGADVVVLDSLSFILENGPCLAGADGEARATKCVLVAMDEDQAHFLAAIRRGVIGYVLQDASANDVVAAIRAVAIGEAVCPPRFARVLFDYVAWQSAESPNSRGRAQLGLTRREQQLIPLIGQGLTNKEIAGQLSLSEQTVKNHIHRILRKVGADDRLSAFEACQLQSFGL